MSKDAIVKALKLASSDNDHEIAMALKSLQGLFDDAGVGLQNALVFAFENLETIKAKYAPPEAVQKKDAGPVQISGMPQARSPKAGVVEIIPPGATEGTLVQLQGAAGEQAGDIAFGMKDALVAAVINKSRFKLKVVDVKNARGDVVETILQAEYEREGMTPVRVWGNVKGEVAALATVMRTGVKTAFPDLMS
jgi:hypothetical protein